MKSMKTERLAVGLGELRERLGSTERQNPVDRWEELQPPWDRHPTNPVQLPLQILRQTCEVLSKIGFLKK